MPSKSNDAKGTSCCTSNINNTETKIVLLNTHGAEPTNHKHQENGEMQLLWFHSKTHFHFIYSNFIWKNLYPPSLSWSHPGAEPGPVLGTRPSLFIPCKPTLTFRHKEGALGIILVNVLLIHYLARAGGRGISHNGKGKICFLNLLSSHFHSIHFEKTLF